MNWGAAPRPQTGANTYTNWRLKSVSTVDETKNTTWRYAPDYITRKGVSP